MVYEREKVKKLCEGEKKRKSYVKKKRKCDVKKKICEG